MATFELINDGIYKVEGEITKEDVDKINGFQIRTCLILQNTKGQSSEVVKQIKTDNVYFSILGGLDYFNKEKFNKSNYIERTKVAPKGFTKILEYFEEIEEGINPEWTDTQKCMYAYNALAVDTNYVKDLKKNIILAKGVTERGLNGILYNQLTCAGMAQTFKEMMDRIDIPCYYQNQRHTHAFNVVELKGKYRGIDVTWDCTKGNEKNCSFKNFGCNPNFYEQYGHQITDDSEETVFDLTIFTPDEIRNNYATIEEAIQERKKIVYPFRNFDMDIKKRFLPVDKFMENLNDEKLAITKLKLLRDFGTLTDDMNEMVKATNSRYGFIADYIGTNHDKLRDTLDDICKRCNINGNLTIKNGQVILITHNENGRSDTPLTQEQKNEMSPILLSDVKEYYKKYFENESSQIDGLVKSYSILESMPSELLEKLATLKVQLYTKIKLFANGDKFFEKLGIKKEEIELVGNKARSCLNSTRESTFDSKLKHENDLDFLYAIIQNDIIDNMVSGRDYTEDDLSKLMRYIKMNWKEAEFSDDEFKALLDEALSKTINPEDISKATLNLGIGFEEVQYVANEIRRGEKNDFEPSQQK